MTFGIGLPVRGLPEDGVPLPFPILQALLVHPLQLQTPRIGLVAAVARRIPLFAWGCQQVGGHDLLGLLLRGVPAPDLLPGSLSGNVRPDQLRRQVLDLVLSLFPQILALGDSPRTRSLSGQSIAAAEPSQHLGLVDFATRVRIQVHLVSGVMRQAFHLGAVAGLPNAFLAVSSLVRCDAWHRVSFLLQSRVARSA
jgi:hypothetical protein